MASDTSDVQLLMRATKVLKNQGCLNRFHAMHQSWPPSFIAGAPAP